MKKKKEMQRLFVCVQGFSVHHWHYVCVQRTNCATTRVVSPLPVYRPTHTFIQADNNPMLEYI